MLLEWFRGLKIAMEEEHNLEDARKVKRQYRNDHSYSYDFTLR
jgi:hypothetical protein